MTVVAAAGMVGLVPADGVDAAPGRARQSAPRIDSDGVWAVWPSGRVDQVFRVTPRESVGRVHPSPSHRRLTVWHSTTEGGSGTLSVIDLVTRRISRPLNGIAIRDYEWSGDNHLIISVVPHRLERLDLRTGRRTTIWNGDDEVQNFEVTPDGQQVVFRRECPCDDHAVAGHSLFAVGSDGSNPRQLISPLHRYDNRNGILVSPDSRRVAVLAGGKRSIVNLGTGAVTALARSPQYYPDKPQAVSANTYQQDQVIGWSPDSDWVAFSHPHLGTAVYRSDGSGAVEGLSSFGLAFGPDHQLAHLSGDRLRRSKLPDQNGPVLLEKAATPLWPGGGALHATGPTDAAGGSYDYGLWRFSPGGRPRLIGRLPQVPYEQGDASVDIARSTIRLEWSEPAPDDVVEQREQVIVIL